MGVEVEVDPGLRLSLEVLLLGLGLEVLRAGALDRQVDVPGAVVDAVDETHGAALVDLLDLVQVKDDVAYIPDGGDLGLGRARGLWSGPCLRYQYVGEGTSEGLLRRCLDSPILGG